MTKLFVTLRCMLLIPVTVGSVMPANGQGTSSWSWNLYFENDKFVPPAYSSDARYTNGLKLTLTRCSTAQKRCDLPKFMMKVIAGLNPKQLKGYDRSASLVLGQYMFTPSVLTSYDMDPHDRPFAGVLFGSLHVDITEEDAEESGLSVRDQHSFEFDVGTLGWSSFAGDTQKRVHILLQRNIPKGWPHQLTSWPVIQGLYRTRASLRYGWFDVVPRLGVALGTVQTFANVGATVRLERFAPFPVSLMQRP